MSGLIALSDWLAVAPEAPIAHARDKLLTKSDLCKRTDFWCGNLPLESGQRWAVYHPDTFEFLALIMALWQRGCTACIPGDNLSATVQRLHSRVDGFAGDFPEECLTLCYDDNPGSGQGTGWVSLDESFQALEIYTSGSTGEPKPIHKTIGNIDSELRVIETLWPESREPVVVSTVSHQHLYGMTFRLFWPLSRGQVFETGTCQYSEDIFRQINTHPASSLISTPSHLSRLNKALDWQSVSGNCVSVLSSAAPLKRDDSLMVSQLLQAPVREIYGSSETGAIGWRIQGGAGDALWQPLPGVSFSCSTDGHITVHAPQIEHPLLLADQLVINSEGHFRLIGRQDRIAKVEGKRVSLAEVEQAAEQHGFVKLAKALVVTRKRAEVALVIELTELGQKELHLSGKRGVQKLIRQQLQSSFETVLLPRRWRFVEQMPYNAQGKIPMGNLKAMFEPESIKWPELISTEADQDRVEFQCRIPAGLVYFDGHFEGNPILPGIVQVHWAEHYSREYLDLSGKFQRLEVVKFQQVIFPDSVVSLSLEYNRDKQKTGVLLLFRKGSSFQWQNLLWLKQLLNRRLLSLFITIRMLLAIHWLQYLITVIRC